MAVALIRISGNSVALPMTVSVRPAGVLIYERSAEINPGQLAAIPDRRLSV